MRDPNNQTLTGLLTTRSEQRPDDPAFMEKDSTGTWRCQTWAAFFQGATALAASLAEAGITPGSRAAILLPNGVAWEQIQHGALMAGCEITGLDLAETGPHLALLLERLSPRVLALADARILAQVPESVRAGLCLIVWAGPSRPDLPCQIPVLDLAALAVPSNPASLAPATQAAVPPLPDIQPEDPAIRIFTSGTTGPPKAMAYTHGQVAFAVDGICRAIGPFLPARARSACWLPLSSPFQRMVNYCGLVLNLTTWMVPAPAELMGLIREIRPHFLAGVPRFYEKIHEAVRGKLTGLPGPLKKLAAWLERAATDRNRARNQTLAQALSLKIGDRLFFRPVRQTLGGSIRFLISGSAPLDRAILDSFSAWGLPLLESYGISENLLPMAMNTPGDHCPGSVGKILPGNRVIIGPDSGIRVRGKGVASGLPLNPEGFLETGDMGEIDPDGFLRLLGRQSDLFKLSTGRKIAPQEMETLIRSLDPIDHALVCGAGKKYPVLLVNLPRPDWERRVTQAGSPVHASLRLLENIQKTCRARGFSGHSIPVRLLVIPGAFSPRTGELTLSMKLKRAHVLALFEADIEALYQGTQPVLIRRAYP